MAQKNFVTQVKSYLKGSQINATIFWQAFEQKSFEQNPSFYTLQLLQNIMSPTNKQFTLQNQQSMYSTLLAVSYYKDRKQINQQTEAKCKKYITKLKLSDAKWVLELFMGLNKDQIFIDNFMNRIACVPNQIDWNKNVALQIQKQRQQVSSYLRQRQHNTKKIQDTHYLIKKMSYPATICPQTKILSPSYICFLDYIRDNMNEMKPIDYHNLICIFKALLQSIRTNSSGQYHLCAFIHFTISCITFYSCTKQNMITQLMQYANHLRNCWGIVGEMGSQLFNILYNQLRIPGHAFRKKLRQDFPALDIKQCSFLNKQYYMVTNSQDCFSCPQDRSLLNLRKIIIWHIMKVCGLQQQYFAQYLQMMRGMAADLTYQMYFKTMKIIDITIQFQVFDEIKKIIKQKMLQLLTVIYKKYNVEQKSKRAQPMETQQFDSLIRGSNYYNIFKYPTYQVVHVPLQDFTDFKSKLSFFSVLKKYRAQQSNSLIFYKGAISIIFYGTSLDFIGIVQILARFLEQADIQQVRKLQVFYIPKPQPDCHSQISSYIANKDIWYRWFIYNITKQKSIIPYIDINKQTKNLFPSYILNKSIHLYLREAKRVLNLKVYKCTIKIKDNPKLETAYFTNNISVGLFALAEVIRTNKLKKQQKRQKYGAMTLLEVIKQKIPKLVACQADIGFQYIQNTTNTVHHKKEKSFRLVDFQLCSLPKQNFFGDMPDPEGNALKLSILSQYSANIFIKQLHNKQNFKQNRSVSQIFLAFKDLFINYSVKSLSLKINSIDHENFLKVLIDGVLFQRVISLQIQSPKSINGLPIAIPIQTFLPFK